MLTNYVFKPYLVKKILYITHKGKKSNYIQSLHSHAPNIHEMIYMDYGNITLTINQEIINLKSGNVIFVSGNSQHSFSEIDKGPFDFLNILFRGEVPELILDKVLPMSKVCLHLMERLKEESIHDMPYRHEMIACNLTELIMQFFRQVSGALPNKPVEAAHRIRYKSEVINRAMNLIAQNYSSPLTLKQLSFSVCISISHLRALLKKETGESFTDILHKHRINAAKYLLREENLLIGEVASAVGYSSASFFFKIFKRITGMTPKHYALTLGEPKKGIWAGAVEDYLKTADCKIKYAGKEKPLPEQFRKISKSRIIRKVPKNLQSQKLDNPRTVEDTDSAFGYAASIHWPDLPFHFGFYQTDNKMHGPRITLEEWDITPGKYQLFHLGEVQPTPDSVIWFSSKSWSTMLKLNYLYDFKETDAKYDTWVSLKFPENFTGKATDLVLCDQIILVKKIKKEK